MTVMRNDTPMGQLYMEIITKQKEIKTKQKILIIVFIIIIIAI